MRLLGNITRRARKGERGQTLVEFALVSLVFFLFLFGIFDMARLFQSWITVQHSARESARYAITGLANCDLADRDACIEFAAKKATTGITRGGPDALDADVDVTFEAWDYMGSSWVGPINNQTGKACDQIEVTVTYQHQFMTPMLQAIIPGGVTLRGMQRMTNEPFGPCEVGDGVQIGG